MKTVEFHVALETPEAIPFGDTCPYDEATHKCGGVEERAAN